MTDQNKEPIRMPSAAERRELQDSKYVNTRLPWFVWAALGAVLGVAAYAWFFA